MKNSRFAGELLVAAELTRLGFSVALHNTFGTNTQDFDLTVGDEEGVSVQVQVKALKFRNAFLVDPERIKPKVAYVFVIVGTAGTLPEFWIALGKDLLRREQDIWGNYGRGYERAGHRGFSWNRLPASWQNNWKGIGLILPQ